MVTSRKKKLESRGNTLFSKSFPESLDAAEEADSGTDVASYARPGNTTLGLVLNSCLLAKVVIPNAITSLY